MKSEEEIKQRIEFYEKQQKETTDMDYKITCGTVIGVLKWILI